MALYEEIIDNYKIVFLGDTNVGKTSFVQSFIANKSIMKTDSTLGVSFQSSFCKLKNKDTSNHDLTKISVWDTAGQERFRSIVKMYFKNVHGFVIMYDVRSETASYSLEYWYDIIQEECPNSYILIVCNKIDLPNNGENIEIGKRFAKDKHVEFMCSSVKDLFNINNCIIKLCYLIKENENGFELKTQSVLQKLVSTKKQNDSSCHCVIQ